MHNITCVFCPNFASNSADQLDPTDWDAINSVHMTAHHNTSNPSQPVFPAQGVASTP